VLSSDPFDYQLSVAQDGDLLLGGQADCQALGLAALLGGRSGGHNVVAANPSVHLAETGRREEQSELLRNVGDVAGSRGTGMAGLRPVRGSLRDER
jgi:hypothetical protein